MNGMKVVILCGGLGTRLREETEFKPKPMVLVGGRPILWHIMKIYSHYGHKDFVLCLGHKGDLIKDYFLKHNLMSNDFTISLSRGEEIIHNAADLEEWNITFADTGQETNTGGRIKAIRRYVPDEHFFLTYSDGLADVDIHNLLRYHLERQGIVTLTAVQPTSRFGIVEFDARGVVKSFKEKPKLDGWINGGFFVCHRDVFEFIGDNDIFEQSPLMNLAKKGRLVSYPHTGLWECMDTFKDVQQLNQLWDSGHAFWKVWKD